jgi:small-conductance mechanosensitive channel
MALTQPSDLWSYRRMIRVVFILLCAVWLAVPTPSFAQKPASPPAISAEQARAALDVLSDPAKRAAFTATLNAIVKAQPAAANAAAKTPGTPAAEPAAGALPTTTVEGLKIPLAPDSLGAEVLLSASDFVNQLGNQATEALDTVQSLPLLYGWVVMMATNDFARGILVDIVWRVALVLICAAAAEYGLRLVMRRPIRSLEALAPSPRHADPQEPPEPPEPDEDAVAIADADESEAPLPKRRGPSAWNLLKRVPLVLARLLLQLIPVLGIVLIGHLIAGSRLGGRAESRLIMLAVVDSYAACAAMLCVVRMLLSPGTSRLRLFHLRDTTAAYLMYWSRRLILIAVFGYAIGEVGLLLGLSDIAHEALQKGVGLLLHLCLVIMVIQKRRAVRRRLRAPPDATGLVASVRNGLASVWHWIALFFLIGSWLIWAIEVPHGYAAVLHYFVVTALVLIGARLVLLLLLGMVDRFMQPVSNGEGFYPGMHARLGVYHPVVTVAFRLTIYLVCALGLLQLYGLNTFFWLIESQLGLRILSASGTLLVTIVLAFGAWEAINGGVQQHLDRLQRESQLAKSARLRTLLPLLRTTVLITIAIIAGLMILGQIGINIAPLLAGAGIIGVAIGFGSQKLVQDLITGIFLLLENAMQVGDVVSVGGLAGVVESLSVRTIRLRSEDGSVYIIPFSSVTTVTNMTRDYSRAVIVASVAYKDDYDEVVAVLRGIVQEMRAEDAWKTIILDDLEVWGLDHFGDSAVNIKCRIMCTPFGRWSVLREFNRRMKTRFDEHGIEIPFPHRKLVMDMAPADIAAAITREAQDEKQRAAD